jgi:hypothetical protein
LSQALTAVGRRDEALAVLRRVLTSTDSAFSERAQAQELLRQLGG